MEELNPDSILSTEDDAGQEPVVAAQEPAAEDGATAGEQTTEPGPQAPAKPAQTAEENARFAQFRREAQAARREAEQARAAAQRAQNVLNRYGYQGDNLDEVLDTLEAAQRNISVSELSQERAAEAERFRQAMQHAPEVVQMRRQLAEYQRREDQRILDDDLGEIKRLNPGETAKSVLDLGPQFLALRAAGVDTQTAYNAVSQTRQQNTKPAPPEIGAVNTSTPKEKDYYSPEEVDRLSEKDLENPRVMEAVQRSMTKWR